MGGENGQRSQEETLCKALFYLEKMSLHHGSHSFPQTSGQLHWNLFPPTPGLEHLPLLFNLCAEQGDWIGLDVVRAHAGSKHVIMLIVQY